MSEFNRFWRVFKDTAYFRLSWKIQNSLLDSFKTYNRSKETQSLNNNIEEIKDKVYNNNFTKKRLKK